MHLGSCHTGCRQSIASVSSPLRTRVLKLSERRCIPSPSSILVSSYFLSPSPIHPSIHPSFSPPNSSRGSFANFHPLPKSRDFSTLSRHRELFPPLHAQVSRRSISKIGERESFPERLLPPGRRHAR